MVCAACGCDQVPGQFCRQCGVQIAPIAAPGAQQQAWIPPVGYSPYAAAMVAEQRLRVRQNLQPLGIVWIMFGVWRLVMGMVGAFVVHSLVRGGIFSDAPPFLPHLMGSLVPVIATVSVVMGAGAILAGYGLLSRQTWGRTVAIVLGVLALLKIPFGTALGIYTLWVLAPRASWAEWETLTQQG
jgi:hypothetical protein